MKRTSLILTGLAAALYTVPAMSAAVPDTTSHDPAPMQDIHGVAALYGDRIEFDVVRNGTVIGSHIVDFKRDDTGLQVNVDFRIEIRALFLTLYRMTYQSVARWQDAGLVSLYAETNRDGDTTSVRLQESGGRLVGNGPSGSLVASLGTYPTNHWNAGVRESDTLINTISGRVNAVRLLPVGETEVETERGLKQATHYRYVGAIENEVWYDDEGRWLAMRFPADDGSSIELRCRKCFPTSAAQVSR